MNLTQNDFGFLQLWLWTALSWFFHDSRQFHSFPWNHIVLLKLRNHSTRSSPKQSNFQAAQCILKLYVTPSQIFTCVLQFTLYSQPIIYSSTNIRLVLSHDGKLFLKSSWRLFQTLGFGLPAVSTALRINKRLYDLHLNNTLFIVIRRCFTHLIRIYRT